APGDIKSEGWARSSRNPGRDQIGTPGRDHRNPQIGDGMRRVLDPKMGLREQILLLLCTSPGKIATAELKNWTGYKNNTYFRKLLREMHEERQIELDSDGSAALILPPGDKIASEIIAKRV
ncbi:hypothetical protein, partial [Bradyrhizobium sp. MOS001]|uniref:hypothetical protein n=1 Tax=Bradyrhizobium sp. MOS001 TaxID=2133948 RepID=UPI0019619CED